MHFFVPYDNSDLARTALRTAYRMAGPLDDVTAMAPVLVPAHLPVNVEIAAIWKSFFRAEWKLIEAQEYAETIAQSGDTLRCVRVQAYDRASAIMAGAVHFHADVLVLARHASIWGTFAGHFGELPRILRNVPCDVHILYAAPEARTRAPRYADDPHDTRTVIRMSAPFQQPFPAAVCEDFGTPDSRLDEVIRSVRRDRMTT